MAEYLSPAVYVEEIPSGIRPLEGVGTSTAGFVGHAVKGPIGEAVPINNFGEFVRTFGTYFSNGFLAYAVDSFFKEGGRTCYVVRTCHYGGTPVAPTAVAANRTFVATGDGTVNALRIEASSPGAWGNELSILIDHQAPDRFRIRVLLNGTEVDALADLTMDGALNDYVVTRVNGVSDFITVSDQIPASSTLSVANRRPAATGATPTPLASGDDGLSGLVTSDYVGTEPLANGLHAFDKVDDVNILAIPDAVDRDVHVGGMAYCEGRSDCFYVADCQQTITAAADVLDYKTADGLFAGGNAISSKYGALYAPWIQAFDPLSGGRTPIPPSGAIAGRYADVDSRRGVHKAAAGLVDGRLRTALDVTFPFVTADQEKLNPKGINVIRRFPGAGSVIWGARTVSADPEWRYVNVRRLFLFLTETIEEGTTWVVFEPNDRSLWQSIVRNVSAFLRLQWLAGALVGETEEQAFYVKCDDETNPPESIRLGRVITEIGVAPSKPAEFVIFRIMQHEGGAELVG